MSDRIDSHHESPSLVVGGLDRDGGQLAYELKCLVQVETALAVERWAVEEAGMTTDRYGDPRTGRYTTTTLYLETPQLDVYHRRDGYGRHRYRIRRYGNADQLHLECKSKKGDLVSKERTAIGVDEAARLRSAGDGPWAGEWFLRRAGDLGLLPASIVTYSRAAYVGVCPEGPLRLTVDWDVRGRLCADAQEWLPGPFDEDEGRSILGRNVVVELKFLNTLPLPFKSLMRKLTLEPGGVSKYRLGREALGLPAT